MFTTLWLLIDFLSTISKVFGNYLCSLWLVDSSTPMSLSMPCSSVCVRRREGGNQLHSTLHFICVSIFFKVTNSEMKQHFCICSYINKNHRSKNFLCLDNPTIFKNNVSICKSAFSAPTPTPSQKVGFSIASDTAYSLQTLCSPSR